MMIVALLANLLVNSTAVSEPNLTLPTPPAPVLAAPSPADLKLSPALAVPTTACADGLISPYGKQAAGTQGLVQGFASPLSERRAALTLVRFGKSKTQVVLPRLDTGQVTCRSQ